MMAFVGVWWSLERSLPKTTELFSFVRNETLTIKAADGTILQQQGPATREHLKLEEMPKLLAMAFIASEDRRFYQHHGVDYQGIVRAFLSNVRSAHVVEGGSTITQQMARILFLNQERTIWRKVKEVRLSQKIEQTLSKEQILERYLNLVYLGRGAYGVADAAWVYFSKPVNKLTLPEMAMIAGLAPAPNLYSPAVNIEAAQQRRNLVLQRMHQSGVITATDAAAASTAATGVALSTDEAPLTQPRRRMDFVPRLLRHKSIGQQSGSRLSRSDSEYSTDESAEAAASGSGSASASSGLGATGIAASDMAGPLTSDRFIDSLQVRFSHFAPRCVCPFTDSIILLSVLPLCARGR